MSKKFENYVYTSADGENENREEYPRARMFADFIAIIGHAIVIGMSRGEKYAKDEYIYLLRIMSIITIVFHVLYALGLASNKNIIKFLDSIQKLYPDRLQGWFTFKTGSRNTLKWFEYSITATLGTVALATSNVDNEPDIRIILFLIAVAVTEQTTGYAIDAAKNKELSGNTLLRNAIWRNFWTTFLCQAAEFGVLSIYKDPKSLPFIWYTLTWTLFGVWAGVRLWNPYDLSIGTSELVYSLLSTTAKIGLFGSVLAEASSGAAD